MDKRDFLRDSVCGLNNDLLSLGVGVKYFQAKRGRTFLS